MSTVQPVDVGRYRVGGEWLSVEEPPDFELHGLEERATHGICPTCYRDLVEHGLSR